MKLSGVFILSLAAVAGSVCAESPNRSTEEAVELIDPPGDAQLRRTDPGNDGEVNPPIIQGRSANLPDLLEIKITPWRLDDPWHLPVDPYHGEQANPTTASLFRIDLKFNGLVNPPGPLGLDGADAFEPYRFGNSPVYGFLELDVDRNRETGGELGSAAMFRYLAIVGRFGEMPVGPSSSRVVRHTEEFDGVLGTAPQYERSGAEFVLQFCGCFTPCVVSDDGDTDGVFGPGDTWVVSGRFFRRAGGFQNLSGAYGGSAPGQYDPVVNLRFRHSVYSNTTSVTLVYAMTQPGAADLLGPSVPTQPKDDDVSNHSSIEEALGDVIKGAGDPFLPIDFPDTWVLANGWAFVNASTGLNCNLWRVNAAVGTSYSTAEPGYPFVWTDTGFDQRFGDLNADGVKDAGDRDAILFEIAVRDGGAFDCDGIPNGSVSVCGFSDGFSMFDLNYDGVVDASDILIVTPPLPGDLNGDCLVNTSDLVLLLLHFGESANIGPEEGDINGDGTVNTSDLVLMLVRFGQSCL